ncbi:MAG: biotin--[acetyl-CoA-carboxylase] ligase [Ilumatobacteraceae bacterium]
MIVADHQTAGRGRLDRKWDAPPGANLLVSLLFRLHSSRPLHHCTHIVGLAARAACHTVFDVRPELKWPNDLLIDGRKVAGILAQGGDGFVVGGIGVNVGWAPEGAARLVEDETVDGQGRPLQLLSAMLVEVDIHESMSRDELHAAYQAQLATIGKRVRVEMTAGKVIEGVAVGVDVDARLEVKADDGVVIRVEVGDVIHLRT